MRFVVKKLRMVQPEFLVFMSFVFVFFASFLCVRGLANAAPKTCMDQVPCTTCIPPRCSRDERVDSTTFGQCVSQVYQGLYGDQNVNALIGVCGGNGAGCAVAGPCGLPVLPVCVDNGVSQPCGRSCAVSPGPPRPGC